MKYVMCRDSLKICLAENLLDEKGATTWLHNHNLVFLFKQHEPEFVFDLITTILLSSSYRHGKMIKAYLVNNPLLFAFRS